MLFIFDLLRIANLTNSIVPRSLGNRPSPNITPKLMGISSYPSDVHFFLSTGQHREIILIIKDGVDYFFIVS